MTGKWSRDYILIRMAILGFRLIAPASHLYLAASFHRQKFLISPWFGFYALAEAAFYLFVYLPRNHEIQKAATHPPSLTYEERQSLFRRCKNYLAGDHYPTGWFRSSDIKRENVVLWTLWALFSTETYQSEWDAEINGYLAEIEGLLDRKLENGYADQAKAMRLTLDPVVTLHRPLVWYIIVGGVDMYSSLSIRIRGFKHYTIPKWFHSFPPRPHTILSEKSADPDLSYWYRPHRSTTKLPVVFLHGIGVLPFFSDLIAQDPHIGILVIEVLPISMHITSPPLDRDAYCRAVSRILASLEISRITLVSHSYGTVLTTHMLHDPFLSPLISSIFFIDPIPFLLHLPNVAFNFVYREPRLANEWKMWYFASRDADISRALSRHFFWAENVLWKEELEGRKVAVVLSGADQIVNAEEVRKYLTGEQELSRRWEMDGLEVLFYPELDHGMVFDTKERRKPVLDIVGRFVRLE
ncbi:hypothetical protein PILCRDRAFT_814122 [Piloderma croceum F 1598]|uniref:AB hydrolase-1 domain-containing protein n=1 Tax=Piloderma croceum (strain F 1598) TaxID=765440 RepID=A0A0C3G8Z2_PILCF|nr:hypothetical protein PILCRDRAFT_814122 [Piloderma croceum F 1598]